MVVMFMEKIKKISVICLLGVALCAQNIWAGYLVTILGDNKITVYDTTTLEKSAEIISCKDEKFQCVACDSIHKYIAAVVNTISDFEQIRIWAILNGDEGQVLQDVTTIEFSGSLKELLFSPDGRYLVASDLNNQIKIWDVSTWKQISMKCVTNPEGGFLRFSPDSAYLVLIYIHRMCDFVEVIKTESWKMVSKLNTKELKGCDIFAIGRESIVAVGKQRMIIVGNLQNIKDPQKTKVLNTNTPVTALVFSSSGKLVSGDCKGEIIVWDIISGGRIVIKPAKAMISYDSKIKKLEFSLDGKRLIAAMGDKTIRGWRTDNWAPVGESIRPEIKNKGIVVDFSCMGMSEIEDSDLQERTKAIQKKELKGLESDTIWGPGQAFAIKMKDSEDIVVPKVFLI